MFSLCIYSLCRESKLREKEEREREKEKRERENDPPPLTPGINSDLCLVGFSLLRTRTKMQGRSYAPGKERKRNLSPSPHKNDGGYGDVSGWLGEAERDDDTSMGDPGTPGVGAFV